MNISEDEKKKIIEKQILSFKKKVNKNKKNIFKSILKEIKTTSKKLYWKSFFNLSYFYKSFLFSVLKKKIEKNKIYDCVFLYVKKFSLTKKIFMS